MLNYEMETLKNQQELLKHVCSIETRLDKLYEMLEAACNKQAKSKKSVKEDD